MENFYIGMQGKIIIVKLFLVVTWFYICLLCSLFIIMIITVDVMKEVLDRIPGDFEIVFVDNDEISHFISDKFEVDVSGRRVLLKS